MSKEYPSYRDILHPQFIGLYQIMSGLRILRHQATSMYLISLRHCSTTLPLLKNLVLFPTPESLTLSRSTIEEIASQILHPRVLSTFLHMQNGRAIFFPLSLASFQAFNYGAASLSLKRWRRKSCIRPSAEWAVPNFSLCEGEPYYLPPYIERHGLRLPCYCGHVDASIGDGESFSSLFGVFSSFLPNHQSHSYRRSERTKKSRNYTKPNPACTPPKQKSKRRNVHERKCFPITGTSSRIWLHWRIHCMLIQQTR